MLRAKRPLIVLLALVSLLNYSFAATQKKKTVPSGTPVLWQEPTDISARDLYAGAGGDEMKPDLNNVTYVKDRQGGWSTKYEVRDGAGNKWVAKVGKEAQSDTAANRLLWAVGYVTEVAYLAPHVDIKGKGSFDNVRFEARPKDVKRTEIWSWKNNPFLGKPEFQGLKVMMLLINNWDIKDENNKILAVTKSDGSTALHYIISDLGGSLGKTGGIISRSRNKPSDFVKAKFIEGVKNGHVDFNYGGKSKELFDDITVDQAKWMGSLLARLTDAQIRDAFRAANYTPDEIEQYTQALKNRIDQLMSLPE